MRRGSRKKQQDQTSRGGGGESQQRPVAAATTVATKRQQPPQEAQQQQQRKKYQDEVSSLTTKNYRLAKELADLRQRNRDESRNVSRLTMENMNLASRCREAISHVAMLKKELAMQQKRTVQALASQREQNQRMTDSLTSSFISSTNSPGIDGSSKLNRSRRVSGEHESVDNDNDNDDDENVTRLISDTPSPGRTNIIIPIQDDDSKPNGSGTNTETSKRASSPIEEVRDSPATSVTASPKIEMEPLSNIKAVDKVVDSVKVIMSSLGDPNSGEELIDAKESEIKKTPALCSTPKRNNEKRSSLSKFRSRGDNDCDEVVDENETGTGMGLFPFSPSSKAFSNSHSNRGTKSYDEQFPTDMIHDADIGGISNSHGNDSRQKVKMNLMNSVDAFEQSFSTDFPDSFTQIEGTKHNALGGTSKQDIYNPFFPTPEKVKEKQDTNLSTVNSGQSSVREYLKPDNGRFAYRTQLKEEGKTELFDEACITPAKNKSKNAPLTAVANKDTKEGPQRPEKVTPSTVRARYEKAYGTTTDTKQKSGKSVTSIVDEFEHNHMVNSGLKDAVKDITNSNDNDCNVQRKSRRRSVKKPISYAEPALNTKLRQGTAFFPKISNNCEGSIPTTNESTANQKHTFKNEYDKKQRPTTRLRHELSTGLGSYWESAIANSDQRSKQLDANDRVIQSTVVSPEKTVV